MSLYMSMEAVKVCCLFSGTVHKFVVFSNVLIFIPFGVGCKKFTFIDAFTNIRGCDFCFVCKSDWNVVLQPLVVSVSKLCCGICCGEHTSTMFNFKDESAKKLVTSCFFLGGAER